MIDKSFLYPKNNDKIVCKNCQKEFIVTDLTRFMISDSFACSWKCFLEWNKNRKDKKKEDVTPAVEIKTEEIKEEPVVKRKRGRPRKIDTNKPLTKVALW